MEQEISALQQKRSIQINRLAYILFLVLVLYQVIDGNLEWAIINLGVAMVFDPFDPTVKWKLRPAYQQILLIVHLSLTIAGLLYLILN